MPKLGVSSCVLGQKVRFDGGHKRSFFVSERLAEHFHLIPICPEVGIGMPVPRPAIRLVEVGEQEQKMVRLQRANQPADDYTEAMQNFFLQKSTVLAQLDGYVLAAKSPSCGVHRIKVYNAEGQVQHRSGQGLFAHALLRQFPHLPVEEDGRLNDAGLRESFVCRVFAYSAFRQQVLAPNTSAALVNFHSRYKFLVLAYQPTLYRSLGRLVANLKQQPLMHIQQQYLGLLMKALSKPTTRKKHTNVLMHLQGFFKKLLSKEDKQALCEHIEQYRLGYLPLQAPITLLQHHLRHHPNRYLSEQIYLNPYPLELGLSA